MSLSVQARSDVLQSLSETLNTCQFPTNEDLSSGRYAVVFNEVLRQLHEAMCVMVDILQGCTHDHLLEHEAQRRESDSEGRPVDQAGGNGDQKTIK